MNRRWGNVHRSGYDIRVTGIRWDPQARRPVVSPTPRELVYRFANHPRAAGMVTSPAMQRLIAGRYVSQDAEQALDVAQGLAAGGAGCTLHLRAFPVRNAQQARAQVDQYLELIEACHHIGLADADISVKMEQMGYLVGGPDVAGKNLVLVTDHAQHHGITVTLDMEQAEQVQDTLDVWRAVHAEFPSLGVAIQASLLRSEQDCADLGQLGARVRLCKGGYRGIQGQSYLRHADTDRAYVRCGRRLIDEGAYPMFATHDVRLLRIMTLLADDSGLTSQEWELQTLQGIAPHMVRKAIDEGVHVRCYLPFGPNWYSWFVGRMVEKPSNAALLVRSVVAA